MTPEFSRFERLDTIGVDSRQVEIEADAAERQALTARFGLLGLDRLAARFAIRRDGAGVLAIGRVSALAWQACVGTGDPVEAAIDEEVALRFVDDQAPEGDAEVELGPDSLDTLPIERGGIDLGEAAAETLALALPPFPRSQGADAALREAGVIDEAAAARLRNPFGALAAMKDRLKD